MHSKEERDRIEQEVPPAVSREIAAEAAVWIARLHGPDRSNHMERECRAWQARSAAHRLAFERGTDLWMDAAVVDRVAVARAAAIKAPAVAVRAGRFKRWHGAIALASVLLAVVLVLEPWRTGDAYQTGVGEQRVVMLQDGTRMSLNTSTRVRVAPSASRRSVEVESGEALFEVAKDASRPFVVRAADSEVTATGTAFVVRYTPALKRTGDAVDVTLVEGRVVVRDVVKVLLSSTATPAVEMVPGQRLRSRASRR